MGVEAVDEEDTVATTMSPSQRFELGVWVCVEGGVAWGTELTFDLAIVGYMARARKGLVNPTAMSPNKLGVWAYRHFY